MEYYKKIQGFDLYEVSNIGNVKSIKFSKEKYLNTPICGGRYVHVTLFKGGKRYNKSIHKIMAIAFLNHTETDGFIVHHINNDKLDNRLENLKLITSRQNTYTHNAGLSKYRGVSWNKSKAKWISRIWDGTNRIFLGSFKNEIDAHEAYQNKLKTISK